MDIPKHPPLNHREKRMIATITKMEEEAKDVMDYRRAIAIYAREETADDWENDNHAIRWFLGKYTEENYQ